MIIGVDFDNTIINYNDPFYDTALKAGWIEETTDRSKNAVREQVRQLKDGEIKWQRLQAIVYSTKLSDAKLVTGAAEFFINCNQRKIPTNIISHKTKHAKHDEKRINIREAALTWMKEKHFFEPQGLGLSAGDVFFESTRQEKIERIKQLGCTHFIDDLEEMFLEDSFPSKVEKILYAPKGDHLSLQGVLMYTNWKEINDYFFGA